ncbi:prolyl aminopeptidase [Oryzifoliimicrobium ureilyticus]|uniref:prolyl aminopeptidase n=1 Tax=Oryzifoliimicrobium ureilyticus TaxID=3113724 RepID=UPI0030760A9F
MLYPEIEPYAEGLLDVGEGHQLYWETSGNPHGQPVVVLHGGPGSGSSPHQRRLFDPSFYRIVLFDQRNCGKSLPHASANNIDLSANTTWHLVDDIEKLRVLLGIDTWLLFGGSWGSTLALAYGQQHPSRVSGIILAGVTTTRQSEIDWLTNGLARLFPAEWDKLCSAIPVGPGPVNVVESYHALVHSTDRRICLQAGWDWHEWELASILLADPEGTPRRWRDPLYRLARARIVLHYFHNAAWLDENQLLSNAGSLLNIKGILIQGRLDLEAPLTTAWELSKAWPNGKLVIVEKAAHSIANPNLEQAITAATDEFREFF